MSGLRDLERAATPGPWPDSVAGDPPPGVRYLVHAPRDEDAALLVALRNLAPELLDVVDAARNLNMAVQELPEGEDPLTEALDYALAALDAKAAP